MKQSKYDVLQSVIEITSQKMDLVENLKKGMDRLEKPVEAISDMVGLLLCLSSPFSSFPLLPSFLSFPLFPSFPSFPLTFQGLVGPH
jgi:hypothetical protein